MPTTSMPEAPRSSVAASEPIRPGGSGDHRDAHAAAPLHRRSPARRRRARPRTAVATASGAKLRRANSNPRAPRRSSSSRSARISRSAFGKRVRIGGVDDPAGARLAHDPSDLGAGVDARQHRDAARHQVHELRRKVELVDVRPLGDEPDRRALQLRLQPLEQQAGHLDAVGADLRGDRSGELAGAGQDQANLIVERRRELECPDQRRKVL